MEIMLPNHCLDVSISHDIFLRIEYFCRKSQSLLKSFTKLICMARYGFLNLNSGRYLILPEEPGLEVGPLTAITFGHHLAPKGLPVIRI